MQQEQALHCFCRSKPKLAAYGINDKGELFIHIKVYKQNRIFGEVVLTGGKVTLRCRVCYRWHTIHIRQPENLPVLHHEKTLSDSFPSYEA